MQVLWLLALRRFRRRRRAVSTITASATAPATPCGYVYYGEDDGPFFDLDLSSCCSAPASSAESSSSSESEDSSSCAGGGREVVDFVVSLQRSCSASPAYESLSFGRGCGWGRGALPPQLKFCASEPNDAAARFSASSSRRVKLRTLSFGSAKAAFYSGRASFSRSSSSARSARHFAASYGHGSPSPDQDHEEEAKRTTPSADVFRRYLSRISRRLRRVAPPAAADLRGLRKSRSASAAQTATARAEVSSPSRRDDTLLEKQDGIASAIAHCKESIHRASMSDFDSSLLQSWSDPGT